MKGHTAFADLFVYALAAVLALLGVLDDGVVGHEGVDVGEAVEREADHDEGDDLVDEGPVGRFTL